MRKFLKPPYLFVGTGAILIFMISTACMIYSGILIPNKWFIGKNDIIGCDVSRYQGDIDWDILSGQGISFAYIKATEGSSYIDPEFEENWSQASETDLAIGAYHFFSFESPGKIQAEHFLEVTDTEQSALIPAVDVEFYGSFHEANTDGAKIRKELDSFIQVIEEQYGLKPVIYTTKEAYHHLIKGRYEDCPLWIRSVLTRPGLDREWTLWQYTSRERLPGYKGPERYIDMNVFHGTISDFADLQIHNKQDSPHEKIQDHPGIQHYHQKPSA